MNTALNRFIPELLGVVNKLIMYTTSPLKSMSV